MLEIMPHLPVLLDEVIEATEPQSGETVVDCTLGAAGHSKRLCAAIGFNGTLIGIDADSDALMIADEELKDCPDCDCQVRLKKRNFRNLDEALISEGVGSVDIFLFDLGLRSQQLEESGRGFTFQKDEPLLMTFQDPSELTETDITAHEIVNDWSREHIKDVLEGYGDEQQSSQIAQAIVECREDQSIETTGDLVKIIENVYDASPRRRSGRKKIHPATLTFQALRIATNDEIRALKEALEKTSEFLSPDGRIAVISFHSTEDRVVKRTFDVLSQSTIGITPGEQPIIPSQEEIRQNPRARSAKLRIFKRIS